MYMIDKHCSSKEHQFHTRLTMTSKCNTCLILDLPLAMESYHGIFQNSTFGITSSSAETAKLAETKIIQKDISPDNSYYNNQGVQRVVRRKSKCIAQSFDQHVLMLKGLTGTHTIIYVQITLNIQTKSI